MVKASINIYKFDMLYHWHSWSRLYLFAFQFDDNNARINLSKTLLVCSLCLMITPVVVSLIKYKNTSNAHELQSSQYHTWSIFFFRTRVTGIWINTIISVFLACFRTVF
jgi:hypothetical protein